MPQYEIRDGRKFKVTKLPGYGDSKPPPKVVRGKQRCFACGKKKRAARSGRRKNGSWWYLCQGCLDGWKNERYLDQLAIEELEWRGLL
jgi:hypothetical protein